MEQHLDEYMNQFLEAKHYTAWQLIKAYWQSDQSFVAYIFFLVVTVMTISVVGLDVAFNYWYYYFYNALQAYDQHGTIRLLVVFLFLLLSILSSLFIVITCHNFLVYAGDAG